MLIINDVKLSALPEDSRFHEIYQNARYAVRRQFKDAVTLDFPKEKYKQIPNPHNMGARIEKPGGALIKANYMYVTPRETFDVRYYTQEKKVGKEIKYEPSYINFKGRMVLNTKKDWDYLFFLLFVSPVAGKAFNDELAKLQNLQRGGNAHYVLIDEEFDAVEQLGKTRYRAEVEALIISPEFGLSDDKIIEIAIGYGLISPLKEDVSPAIARTLLLKYILAGDNRENVVFNRIQEFKSLINLDDRLAVRKLVREAMELNVLGFRKFEGTKTRVWAVLDPSGEPKEDLCKTNYHQSYENTVEDHLLKNPVKIDEIQEYVKQKKDVLFTKAQTEAVDTDDILALKEEPKRRRTGKKS